MFKFSPGSKNLHSLSARFLLLPALALCSGLVQGDIYRSLDPDVPRTFTNIRPAEGRWELYLREKPTPIRKEPAYDQRRFTVDSRLRYASQIQAAAIANNVDAALIRAVITVESGFNPSAVSRAGAVGLMQLMPETAKRYNVTNSHDPAQNIHGGTRYLRDLLRMFNNDLHLALAAYNAGEQAVMKYRNRIPPFRETLAYVPKVMKFYKRFTKDHVAAGKSGGKRVFTASRKKGTPTRVFRTYAANPA